MTAKRPQLPPLRLLLRSVLYRTKIVDLAVGMFIALIGIAMLQYRGGTWWELERRGHSFWENFLCDLLRRQTLGGAPNLSGSRIALAGMLILVMGIATAYSLVPEVIPSRKHLGKRLARIGVAASACLMLAPLLPSDHFPRYHSLAVLLAGVPTILCFTVLVGAILLEPTTKRSFRAVSLALLVSSAVTLALYAWNAFLHGPALRLLPGLERVANLLLLAWLMMLSNSVRGRLFDAYRVLSERAAKRSP